MSVRRMFPHYQINVETSQTCFTTKCSKLVQYSQIRFDKNSTPTIDTSHSTTESRAGPLQGAPARRP